MNEEDETQIENTYQGLFVTETVLGNPNGSFVNNEPRNIDGRVFTTDKCIKYNIRNYIYQNYEDLESMKNVVFFYPRKSENAEDHQASYMTKTNVYKKYFDSKFNRLLDACIDARLFGGTFSFKGGQERAIYGPVQLSYGLDLIGADIKSLKVGTPFASDEGKQKTTGVNRVVDHAVIAYDITVNPKTSPGLLLENDFDIFKKGIVYGTNTRKSTSKSTDAKALVIIRFKKGKSLNVGEMKHLIEVKSPKITNPEGISSELILDFSKVQDKLQRFKDEIDEIEIFLDNHAKIQNFFSEDESVNIIEKGLNEI